MVAFRDVGATEALSNYILIFVSFCRGTQDMASNILFRAQAGTKSRGTPATVDLPYLTTLMRIFSNYFSGKKLFPVKKQSLNVAV